MLARSIFSESLILDCHVMISPILVLKVESLLCTCFWTVGVFFGFLVVSLVFAGPPPPFWPPGSPSTVACPEPVWGQHCCDPWTCPSRHQWRSSWKAATFWCGHMIVSETWGRIHCNQATRFFWFEPHQGILMLKSQFAIRLHIRLQRPKSPTHGQAHSPAHAID